MYQTIDVVIEKNGDIRLLEPVELTESRRAILTILNEEPEKKRKKIPAGLENHFYFRATPEEFTEAFDALGRGNEDAPQLPPGAFDRENLYDEERA